MFLAKFITLGEAAYLQLTRGTIALSPSLWIEQRTKAKTAVAVKAQDGERR
jgi:hypothetical protein